MLLTDTDGYVFQANNFAVKALAYPEAEIVGSHISRLVPAPNGRASRKRSTGCCIARATSSAPNAACCARTASRSGPTSTSCCNAPRPATPLYFIVQLADITEMKRNQEQMERMAFYDTLTDLANRRLFGDRLEQAIAHAQRTDTCAALLYLDLDQFKRVNDTLGHEAGDELLREVARRLTPLRARRRHRRAARRRRIHDSAVRHQFARRRRHRGRKDPRATARADHDLGSSPRRHHQHRHHDHPERFGAAEHPDQKRRPRDVSREGTRPQQLSVLRRRDEHQGAEPIAHRERTARSARIESSSSCSISRRCGSPISASPASRR